MSRQNLYDVLRDLKIPEASSEDFRFLFYFFGHGTDDEICLADGNFKRSDIISELQKLSPNIFKIIFFDSCRTDSNRNTYSLEVTMHKPIQETAIIQETASIQVLSGLGQSKKEKHYPYADCVNTLVINATIYGHKAYYMYIDNDEMKGCGLVTYFFTTLAPLMNEPLPAVLTEVRVKVDDFIKKEASSLPTSTSLSPQVLDYKDLLMGNVNLLAESKGKARVRPENARIVSKSPLSTMVQWSFQPNVYQRIKSFHVTCRNEEGKFYVSFPVKKEMENVAEFSNASLKPRTTYCAKVVAKYEDGFEAESDEVPFTTKELECAKNLSLHPIKLDPLTAELRWAMSSSDDQLPQHVHHFTVRANDEIIVDRCEKTHAELPLNPGTPYLLTVETSYSDGIHSMTSISEEYHYTTPTKDEMKPKIEFFEVKRNSVVVEVSDPALFQRSEYGKMERDSFHVKCTPIGEDDSNERYKKHTIDIQREAMSNPEPVETMPNSNQVEATPTPDPAETTPNPKPLEATPTPEATPNPESTPNPDPAGAPASYRIPLAGLIAGREYRVKCEMGCSSGDTLTSGEKFAAKKPSCMQRMWQISCCPLILLIFIAIFTPWSVFYGLYHRSEACATHYALANAVVQCGYGTSKYYQGIEIRVSSGDSLQGTLRAWNVREDDLILYSRPIGPYNIDDKLRSPYALLEGWDMYLWEGSVISGFCCVQSRNNDSQTAMLNVFLSEDDAFSFISSEGNTENYIFSETIKIPRYDQNCFRNWGVDRPLRVKRSAYHVFVLHTSTDSNMTFIYNTTIIQKYVNVSDYENPRYFSHKSETYFPYPNGIGNPTDYVTICEAPDYVYQSISNTSSSDDYSTDIISCVTPYGWITPVFATIAGICGVLLYTCIIGVFLICKLHLCSKSKPKDPEQTEL